MSYAQTISNIKTPFTKNRHFSVSIFCEGGNNCFNPLSLIIMLINDYQHLDQSQQIYFFYYKSHLVHYQSLDHYVFLQHQILDF